MIRVILLLTVLLSISSFAASSDCDDIVQDSDRTICLKKKLTKLDEDMYSYYFNLKETLDEDEFNKLLSSQTEWLKRRAAECGLNDTACLVKTYEIRIIELQNKQEHIGSDIVPYTAATNNTFQGLTGTCSFSNEVISDDTHIYAGGSYSGKEINYQIDQSGHQATQFEVIVNSPDNPVALILGAYEPSVWNIAWTQGTKISAVVATGYHKQAVAGLPNNIPILISSHDNGGPCSDLYISKKNLRKINPFSEKVFNRKVTSVHYASNGNLVFGDKIRQNEKLSTSNDTPPDSFYDKAAPLAGQAGLDDFVRKGLIRRANEQDAERWAQLKAEAHKDELPQVASGSSSSAFDLENIHNGYVILKQITIPAGLYGANSATFFLNKGVPIPQGQLGHSMLYDFNTMSVRGSVVASDQQERTLPNIIPQIL